MELTMLGTGNAAVTECYNTCFALREKDEYVLVDAGGGNGILSRLKPRESTAKAFTRFLSPTSTSTTFWGSYGL